jgi:hypothetical protein
MRRRSDPEELPAADRTRVVAVLAPDPDVRRRPVVVKEPGRAE